MEIYVRSFVRVQRALWNCQTEIWRK